MENDVNLIYECPNCLQLQYPSINLKTGKFEKSKCRLYDERYSDGTMISSGTNRPKINICPNCKSVFLNSDAKEMCPNTMDEADFLSLGTKLNSLPVSMEHHHEFLKTYTFKNKSEELKFRKYVMGLYTFRAATNQPLVTSAQDKENRLNNMYAIILLMDDDKIKDRLFSAELYRLMGEFEKSLSMLPEKNAKITYEQRLQKIKIRRRCEAKNSNLICESSSLILVTPKD